MRWKESGWPEHPLEGAGREGGVSVRAAKEGKNNIPGTRHTGEGGVCPARGGKSLTGAF